MIASFGLLAVPGVASAADPTPVAAKYAALGGAAGVLGPALAAEDCSLTGGGCVQDFANGAIVWSSATGAHALTNDEVLTEWVEWGAVEGDLGYPTRDTFCGLAGGGCGQHFTGGSVYWSPASGAVAVYDVVRDVWSAQGWETGPLGYPTSDVECGLDWDACLQHFQRGTVYDSPAGTFAVSGSIKDRWGAQGWERGDLGYPTSAQFCGLKSGGCGQHFEGGSIYRGPSGTFIVTGAVEERWAAQGWENGQLGYPASEQFNALASVGQHFQGGSIYDTWYDGVVLVPVPLRDVWAAEGWERGMGYPTSDAFCGLRNGGCGQEFHNGSIYSSPAGTFAVKAAEAAWAAQGWETGALGYPVSRPFQTVDQGLGQHFQGGSVYTSYKGTFAVTGAIRDKWAALGWERGHLGSPISTAFCGLRGGGCGQHFQYGSIYSSPTGTFAVPTIRNGVSDLRSAWAAQGWESGALGYPTSDFFCGLSNLGCGQHFQGGSVYSVPGPLESVAVPTAIRDVWAARGWENGRYGYPSGPAYSVAGGIAQPFAGGTITVR
ncbi:hypothetical protein [Modestobacter muralis]